jgi:hypothetical protein
MRRREFVRNAGWVAAAACFGHRHLLEASATPGLQGTLTVDEQTTLATVPLDFSGLSYESSQLTNPAFFAQENEGLLALFKELANQGVLRLGGGTSEFTAFTTEEPTGPPPFDSVGPDTSKNVKSDTKITPKSLRNLRVFLDATDWRCLYGLNLGRGPVARAAEEAFHVQSILGPRLIAFQLGNEPDAWRNRYRPANWTYEDYWKEWSAARAAVLTRVPAAKFAGPDVSNNMAYVTAFAEDVKKSAPDVVMLTSHYYAMGPAGAKDVTMEKLLSPDPKLERDLKTAMDAARNAGLPYRMCEGNSCWNGGQEGVSDTLASALWVLDMMLNFAAQGCAGVNLHGGGNGFYTPIAGSSANGFVRRPEFFGMLLAKEFVGATLVRSTLECRNDKVRAYAGRKDGKLILTAINKTEQTVLLKTPLRHGNQQCLLTGPALTAKQDTTLVWSKASVLHHRVLHVEPHSAVLIKE